MRHDNDLIQELNKISSEQLKSEKVLGKHRKSWIDNYKDRACVSSVAIRILVRNELRKLHITNEELIEEVVGSKKKEGIMLWILKNFDICLPTKYNSPLNPQANEFCPNKKWVASDRSVDELDAWLFPSYLTDNEQVEQMWGLDNTMDLNIHVYFLPEIPHGFFHRWM